MAHAPSTTHLVRPLRAHLAHARPSCRAPRVCACPPVCAAPLTARPLPRAPPRFVAPGDVLAVPRAAPCGLHPSWDPDAAAAGTEGGSGAAAQRCWLFVAVGVSPAVGHPLRVEPLGATAVTLLVRWAVAGVGVHARVRVRLCVLGPFVCHARWELCLLATA